MLKTMKSPTLGNKPQVLPSENWNFKQKSQGGGDNKNLGKMGNPKWCVIPSGISSGFRKENTPIPNLIGAESFAICNQVGPMLPSEL